MTESFADALDYFPSLDFDDIGPMKHVKLVGVQRVTDVSEDDVLGMIIGGKNPAPRAGASA